MKKNLYLLIGLVLIVGVAAAAFALTRNSESVKSEPSSATTGTQTGAQLETTQKTVAVVGTIGCLEPSDATATQASSCAVGLQQDDGSSYALNADDPTTTGSIPTGQRVQVTGVVSQESTSYKIDGVIKVKSIESL
ncbi:hypothetical protein BH09PAT3_BH09PAT3_0200 [soil metagenome]